MAQKLSSGAQRKLDALVEARRKMDRIHSLVELAASQPSGEEMYLGQIRRAAADVGRVFMNNGYGPLADATNQMSLATKRGGKIQTKVRSLRELVASVKAGMERAERAVYEEDKKPPAS